MDLIHAHLQEWNETLPVLLLRAPRSSFGKRRWRGVAEDGREFGFDLHERIPDGAVFFQSETARYVLEQLAEPVLEIALPPDTAGAAKLGWHIGNLHFPLELTEGLLRVADDPALRQLCEREQLPFTPCERVFHPIRGGHSHAPPSSE